MSGDVVGICRKCGVTLMSTPWGAGHASAPKFHHYPVVRSITAADPGAARISSLGAGAESAAVMDGQPSPGRYPGVELSAGRSTGKAPRQRRVSEPARGGAASRPAGKAAR